MQGELARLLGGGTRMRGPSASVELDEDLLGLLGPSDDDNHCGNEGESEKRGSDDAGQELDPDLADLI